MANLTQAEKSENLNILLKGSILSVPFNLILGFLLSIYLVIQQASKTMVLIWFITLSLLSIIRIIYSKLAFNPKWHIENANTTQNLFTLLVFATACTWGLSYFLFLDVITGKMAEAIVILFLGGMCVGALISLSVVTVTFYAFLLPIFIPVIVYNYSFLEVSRSIMATMFLFFVLGLVMFARINSDLWGKVFKLTHEKDNLITELQNANSQLQIHAITDSLTGLYNRRHFDEALVQALNIAKRNQQPLSLALIDIDEFKQINDKLGHPKGDLFLKLVAQFLGQFLKRANDQLFRVGGDEFAIILSNSRFKESESLMQTILKKFNDNEEVKKFQPFEPGGKYKVTLSIGLVFVAPNIKHDVEQIVIASDKALYTAKNAGKNRMVSINLE